MKDGKIYAMVAELDNKIKAVNNNQQILGSNAGQLINQLKSDLFSISLYIEARREYEEKYWMLPMAVFPGKKLFKKIYDRKVNEINQAREEYAKKQKAAQEKELEAVAEETKNENKEV